VRSSEQHKVRSPRRSWESCAAHCTRLRFHQACSNLTSALSFELCYVMYGIVIGSVGLGVICHLAYRYLEPGKSGCGVFLYTADIVYAGGVVNCDFSRGDRKLSSNVIVKSNSIDTARVAPRSLLKRERCISRTLTQFDHGRRRIPNPDCIPWYRVPNGAILH
jgi:hypothetical protein